MMIFILEYGDIKTFLFSSLSESQKQLCEKLDEMHARNGLEMMRRATEKAANLADFLEEKIARGDQEFENDLAASKSVHLPDSGMKA